MELKSLSRGAKLVDAKLLATDLASGRFFFDKGLARVKAASVAALKDSAVKGALAAAAGGGGAGAGGGGGVGPQSVAVQYTADFCSLLGTGTQSASPVQLTQMMQQMSQGGGGPTINDLASALGSDVNTASALFSGFNEIMAAAGNDAGGQNLRTAGAGSGCTFVVGSATPFDVLPNP